MSVLGCDQHEAIQAIETYLGQHLIRAYELPTDQARSDTTSFSVYHQSQEEKTDPSQISAQPLLHKGHSKDRRPDLLQYRQMLATLDPLGMPFSTPEERIGGLMFLLTIALRVFTLMEFVVRRQLAKEPNKLIGHSALAALLQRLSLILKISSQRGRGFQHIEVLHGLI